MTSSVAARFTARMETERVKAGLSVNALAGLAGVDSGTLGRIRLGGGCRLETAVAIVKALPAIGGLDWLIDGGETG